MGRLGRVCEDSKIACEGLTEADLVREGLETQQQPWQSLWRL